MNSLSLHEFHAGLNAKFMELNGMEAVADYGDALAEHAALEESAGILDLSFRSRLCLTGADRQKFLNGQVTNNVKDLKLGEGCYAALITAKGKMQSDLNIYCLENELLLDFEPGLSEIVSQRLEKFIIADDTQIVEVSPHYGLLSIQGPKAAAVLENLALGFSLPQKLMNFSSEKNETLGELYLMHHSRTHQSGFDFFVPTPALGAVADKLIAAAKKIGGRPCGWQSLEMARIEAGLPRFGADMDETNLPPEAGLERAVSYTKGCYIGQEVIARIRTYGQVAKALRGLRLANDLKVLPRKGDKIFLGEKEIGYITSAVASPTFRANIALGYVRREANKIGIELKLRTTEGESSVRTVELPFAVGMNMKSQ
ncbi:MAG: aminomethyltransferase family protein [Verrucomicrobiota bacterium]|nr:aminomethyltransferase family protein [Verrucomicrobiota bacterium]